MHTRFALGSSCQESVSKNFNRISRKKKEKKKSCFGGMNQTMQMRKRKNMWDNNARCIFGSFGRGRGGRRRGAFNWLIGGDIVTSCVSLLSAPRKGGRDSPTVKLKEKIKTFPYPRYCVSFLSSLATDMRANGESLLRPFLFEDKLELLWNNWPRERMRERLLCGSSFPTLLSPQRPSPGQYFSPLNDFLGF